MNPPIFVSHEWQDESDSAKAVALIDTTLPRGWNNLLIDTTLTRGWNNLSVPRDRAIAFSERRIEALQQRLDSLSSEGQAIQNEINRLEVDEKLLAELEQNNREDISVEAAIGASKRHFRSQAVIINRSLQFPQRLARDLASFGARLVSWQALGREVLDRTRLLENSIHDEIAHIPAGALNKLKSSALKDVQPHLGELGIENDMFVHHMLGYRAARSFDEMVKLCENVPDYMQSNGFARQQVAFALSRRRSLGDDKIAIKLLEGLINEGNGDAETFGLLCQATIIIPFPPTVTFPDCFG